MIQVKIKRYDQTVQTFQIPDDKEKEIIAFLNKHAEPPQEAEDKKLPTGHSTPEE